MACDFSLILFLLPCYVKYLLTICLRLLFRAILFTNPNSDRVKCLSKLSHLAELNDVESHGVLFLCSDLFLCVSVCVSSFRRHTRSLIFLNKTVISDWISSMVVVLLFEWHALFSLFCACAYMRNIAFRTRSLDSFKSSARKCVNDFYGKNGIWSFVKQSKPQNFILNQLYGWPTAITFLNLHVDYAFICSTIFRHHFRWTSKKKDFNLVDLSDI